MTNPLKKNNKPIFAGDTLYGLPISSGTHQQDRLPPPLQPDWFNIEERSPASLLSMSRQYAAKLCYFSRQNQHRGDWESLFHHDEAAIMAEMLSSDFLVDEEEFLRHLKENKTSAAEAVLKISHKLDQWLGRLRRRENPALGPVLELLEVKANQLSPLLDQLIVLARGKSSDEHFSHLRKTNGTNQPPFSEASLSLAYQDSKELLRATHTAFHQALLALQEMVPLFWQETLESGNHEPAIGLFIAFVQLYCKAIGHGRSFPERHLDFYYQQVLQTRPRQPTPNAVHLVLRTLPGGEAVIQQGDRFSAGITEEAGEEKIYRADYGLRVTDTKVERLQTLSFHRDKLISPAWEMGCFTHCWTNELSVAAEPEPGTEPSSLPLFGDSQHLVRRYGAKEAQHGLVLAAPELLLSQGKREIELTLCYTAAEEGRDTLLEKMRQATGQEEFFLSFGQFLAFYLSPIDQQIPDAYKKRIEQAAQRAEISQASYKVIQQLLKESDQGNLLFYRFLTNVFYIDLSGEDGWLPVGRYVIFPVDSSEPGCTGGLRLSFTLDRDAQPVVGYQADLHGQGFETTLPLLRLRLNHQAHLFTYSIFSSWIIGKVILETKAERVGDLRVANQHGLLDPNQPFQPFGPIPTRQSYMIIGSYEAACKHLTELRFTFDWGELPEEDEGFSGYYDGYTSLDNASFQADFSLLRGGHWVPDTRAQRQTMPLFSWQPYSSEPNQGKLNDQHELVINDLKKFSPLHPATEPEDFFYGPGQGDGFFRWQISGATFGQKEYPELLTKVMTRNAHLKKKQLPLPKVPYTPLINQLTLGYTARCVLDLSTAPQGTSQLYHLSPFGLKIIYPEEVRKPHPLIPKTDNAGNLYIGLSGPETMGQLTLYFVLAPDSDRSAADEQPALSWSYATAQQWRPFPEANLQGDSTNAFLHSGIITLDIPRDISNENKEMGKGLYWLRVSTANDPRMFSSLQGIYSQALRATALPKDTKEVTTAPLPPQSVTSTLSSIVGLTEVLQPEASFNGGRKEDREAVITRLHERLRHKDRAVTPWDYERLVLEHFPDIGRVKCFPHLRTRPKPERCPGGVLVVVVPGAEHQQAGESFPRINAARLVQIRDFLRDRASGFARIEVRNPEYEQIQVRCAAHFIDNFSTGQRIQQLNQAIRDYISPWSTTGYQARFGWNLRLDDILAYLSGQEGVNYITDLSVLHITKDASNAYYLEDSVRDKDKEEDRIRPRYPWSLAVPMPRHFIRSLDTAETVEAEATGVDELRIGATFIINE
ncbi:MAG: baseplate J/gp47 family protein [Candidatus Electrothrix scaldis]|nr:MAG: baseplate J/gp47 family protein [Candidatus Electrothrix sp. GW3-3]